MHMFSSEIRFITVRHERGAAFMADVYGRLNLIDCPVDYAENMKLTEKLGALVCPI